MKRLLKFIMVMVTVATLCFSTKVSADDYHKMYESPELIYNTDLVFSVAKGEVDDWTSGNYYDGKPYGLYSQIHEDINGSGNNGRYTIHAVSGGAIAVGIRETLGEDVRNVNEDYLGRDDAVETILRDYSGIDFDEACRIAAEYIAANRGLELGFYNELWYIDFVALKYQQDGKKEGRIHIDGRVIVNEPEPEPEVEEPVIDEPVIDEPVIEEPIIEELIVEEPVEEEVVENTPTPSPTPAPRFIIIPSFVEPTSTPEPTPTPELIPTDVPIPEPVVIVEEEIEVEEIETPEGAPEEEVDIEEIETPEGDVEKEIEVPEVPEGDVLPQTGVVDSLVFFLFGGWMIALGALLIKRTKI